MLARGNLNNGVTNGGLSYVNGNNSLSNANWNYGARISVNYFPILFISIVTAARLNRQAVYRLVYRP